jgi:nucleoside-diphosphate-sugar epimerase
MTGARPEQDPLAERQRHVVFGAGQIGPIVAAKLAARGHEVRLVRRSAPSPGSRIPVVTGDAGDPRFAIEVCAGAAAVYHCMNPAYSTQAWGTELPRIMTSLITAAGAAGARLVVLDNLYMLGRPSGPIDEDVPDHPVSRKGEIRARIAAMLFDAHRRGDVRAVSGRASDFYGPRGTATHFGDFFWPRVLAGKSAQFLVNPDTPHSYDFTEDVAAGLVTLGEADDDVCGRWWMLPCAPAVTTREMVKALGTALGREIRVERVPRPVLALMGLFMPMIREVSEMLYQWDVPFVCVDRRFRERFGAAATPLDQGARATVEWAREHYGAPR